MAKQKKIRHEQVDAGTNANQLVVLDDLGRMPAVDGSLLISVPAITSLITDLNPQLGGHLDLNAFNIITLDVGSPASVNTDSINLLGGSNAAGGGTFTAGGATIQGGFGANGNDGGPIVINGGNSADGGYGGYVSISSGSGSLTSGAGTISITGGNSSNSAFGGGGISITSGDNLAAAGAAPAGDISLTAGDATTSVDGVGGNVGVYAGDGGDAGGNVILQPGNGVAGADGTVQIKAVSGVQPTLEYFENAANGANKIAITAPANIVTDRTWTLPQDDPATANGQFLTTDASGLLSFTVASTVAALDDLTDVVVAGSPLITDQVLTFNGTNWVNAEAQAGASAIGDLTDVTITGSPAAIIDEILRFNGSGWVNDTETVTNDALNNLVSGFFAGDSITTATDSIIFGRLAGFNLESGADNIFIGNRAGRNGTSSNSNISIGGYAGYRNGGSDNIAMGRHSLRENTSGNQNVSIGSWAGDNLAGVATQNILIGFRTGQNLANASSTNVAIGANSLGAAGGTAAATVDNVAIGTESLNVIDGGSDNVAIGQQAGIALTSGGSNTIIGTQAGANIATGIGNVILGRLAGPTTDQSNKLYIDITQTDTPLIGGDFSANIVTITGKLVATGGVDALTTVTTVVDVSAAAAPTTGQVLTATSGTAATWQTPSSIAVLNDLTDVTLGSPVTNQVLTFDGTNWINAGNTGEANKNWLIANNDVNFVTPPNAPYAGGNSLALGNNAYCKYGNSVSIGTSANSGGNYGVAIGKSAIVSAGHPRGVAIGNNAKAGTEGIGIGNGASGGAGGSAGIAIGRLASADGNNVAIGEIAAVTGNQAIAIGKSVTATGGYSTAVGNNSTTTLTRQIVVGASLGASSVTSDVNYSAKIGYGSANIFKNVLHLFSKGKLELYGDEAQYIFPSYAVGSPATLPANSVEGGVIYDSVANELQLYDGATWSAIGGGGGGASTLNDLTDVVVAGSPLVADQVLTFNGTNWVNSTPGVVHNWIIGNGGADFNISPTAAGAHALAGGRNATGSGSRSIAFGYNAQATSTDAISMGLNSLASNTGSISIGSDSDATANGAVALGDQSQSLNTNSIAVGYQAQATKTHSIAIGQRTRDSTTGAGRNVLIGAYTSTFGTGERNTLVGNSVASPSGASRCTVVGADSDANQTYQTVIGSNITSADVTTDVPYSLKIGSGDVTNLNLIHLHTKGHLELYGDEAQIVFPNYVVTGSPFDVPASAEEGAVIYDSVAKGLQIYGGSPTGWSAIGGGGASTNWIYANNGVDFTTPPSATGSNTIAIGDNASTSTGGGCIAIGQDTLASYASSVAIGTGSSTGAGSAYGIALGKGATITGGTADDCIAIGSDTAVSAGASIVIGKNSSATAVNQVVIGNGVVSGAPLVDGANSVKIGHAAGVLHMHGNGRLALSGSESQFQLPNWITSLRPANAIQGSLIYDEVTDRPYTYDGTAWEAITKNWLIANNGADFATAPTATGSNAITIGNNASSVTADSIAIGTSANTAATTGSQQIVIGVGAYTLAGADKAIAIGKTAGAQGIGSVALGNSARASADHNTVIGQYSTAGLDFQLVMGHNTRNDSVTSDVAYSAKLGYGINNANKNVIHLFSKGKLELYGDEAQFVIPTYAVGGSPNNYPANSVEGGTIFDSVNNVLKVYDGTNWGDVAAASKPQFESVTPTGSPPSEIINTTVSTVAIGGNPQVAGVQVFRNGMLQDEGVDIGSPATITEDFVVSGANQITFAPGILKAGDKIKIFAFV